MGVLRAMEGQRNVEMETHDYPMWYQRSSTPSEPLHKGEMRDKEIEAIPLKLEATLLNGTTLIKYPNLTSPISLPLIKNKSDSNPNSNP